MEGTINWQSQVSQLCLSLYSEMADNFSLQSLIMLFIDMKYRGGFLILPHLVRIF